MRLRGYHPHLLVRCAAECMASALLTFIGAGATVSMALLPPRPHRLGAEEVVVVALAEGLGYFVLLLVLGRFSGAHANPALTLALVVTCRFPWREVPPYLLAQFAGGIIGAAGVLVVYGQAAATIGRLGAPALAPGTSPARGLAVQAIGLGIVAMVLLATTRGRRVPVGWAALAVGLALAAVIQLVAPVTGTTVNPVRAFGADLVVALLAPPVSWGIYLVTYLIGPLAGGVVFGALYEALARIGPRAPERSQARAR